jgi:hypothetical protein
MDEWLGGARLGRIASSDIPRSQSLTTTAIDFLRPEPQNIGLVGTNSP